MKSNYLVICCYHILTYSFNTYLCPDMVKFLINVDEKVSVLILNFQLLSFLNLCDRFNCHLKWNIHSLRKKVILKESRKKESLKKNRRGGKENVLYVLKEMYTKESGGMKRWCSKRDTYYSFKQLISLYFSLRCWILV